jgi:MYXO-CTERM domain-containing protein
MSLTSLKALGAALLLWAGCVSSAAAVPVAYDFTIRWEGNVFSHGSFGFDSDIAPPGGGWLNATGLLSSLSIEMDGMHFDESTGNTGSMNFSPSGELLYVTFGNQCWAGGCEVGLDARFEWWVSFNTHDVSYLPPGVRGLAQWVDDRDGDRWTWTQAQGEVLAGHVANVPEPDTWALMGAGLAVLLLIQRRRASMKALAAALLLGGACAMPAAAIPVTYDFSIHWEGNHWTQGSFGFDSDIAPPGGGTVAATGLLSSLSIEMDGLHFDETTANTGVMQFSPEGELLYVFMGSDCPASENCATGEPGTFEWWMFFYTHEVPWVREGVGVAMWVDNRDSRDLTWTQAHGAVHAGHISPAPEPGTWAFLAAGLAVLGLMRPRRR